MEYFIIEPVRKNIVYSAIETNATIKLLYFLFEIQIHKSKRYKIKYTYNYSDAQTIEITDVIDGYIHRFTNVPTIQGYLYDDKLIKNQQEFYKNIYK